MIEFFYNLIKKSAVKNELQLIPFIFIAGVAPRILTESMYRFLVEIPFYFPLYTLFFLPLILVILLYRFNSRVGSSKYLLLANYLICLFCIWLSNYLDFQNFVNYIHHVMLMENRLE